MIGFRFALAIATSMVLAPAVANACIPRNIEFSRGSARLDTASRAVIEGAADEFRASPNARITLFAQSDGSGSNLRMAGRRARAVRAELVRNGVPPGALFIQIGDQARKMISARNYARFVVMDVVPSC